MVIKELKAIQKQHGFIPRDELTALSERSQVPVYELHGVATFYPHFRLEPPPDSEIKVCCDLSCHLQGAGKVMEAFEKGAAEAGLESCKIERTSCLGCCDRPVAVSINDRIVSQMTTRKAPGMIRRLGQGKRAPNQRLPETGRDYGINPYESDSDFSVLRSVVEGGRPEEAIERLEESGLKGMGGAGFPAGMKWGLVRNAKGRTKYVICNADESEPGTFKDRLVLQTFPDLMIEGMAIAAYCTGAKRGTIFIRHEYYREGKLLQAAINRARRMKAIGSKIFGSSFSFQLDIFESPGGYICGEETALLEALEGKRAEPRNKPPFPGTHGLHGKPTLINNVETFALVPAILQKGPDWYKSCGMNGASGTKFMSLSGDVNLPGVYEVPMGIPAGEFIEEYGGGVVKNKSLKAFSPGGASSGILPASLADIPLDFKPLAEAGSMFGTGAVVAIAEGRCMVDLALNLTRFFSVESCGKCVPCRVGSEKLVDILTHLSHGEGSEDDLPLIEELSEAMVDASICGLGQAAPNPIGSVIRHFRNEVIEHVTKKICREKVCKIN